MDSLKNILNGIKHALDRKADKKYVNEKVDDLQNQIDNKKDTPSKDKNDALTFLAESGIVEPIVIDNAIIVDEDNKILIF